MQIKTNTAKRLAGGIILIVISAVCLIITTFALVNASVTAENNYFHTGTVKINLNDGEPVISENEFIFEPGMTVKKDFFIENQSSCEVFYRLYLTDVSGDLADVLEITVIDGDDVIFEGKANEFTKEGFGYSEDQLALNERRELTISFFFPTKAGDDAQDRELNFTVKAEAVQTKNNPDKHFE